MKKLTTLLISLMLTVALCYPAFGASAGTAKGEKCITITGIDPADGDTDWYSTKVGYPYDLDIWCIVFYPSATNDIMIIHDDGLDTWELFDSGKCADTYDARVLYFPPRTMIRPVIDASDCTIGTPANAKVKIYFR